MDKCKPRLHGDEEASDRLELLDVANTSPNSIEVSWRPPSKNADRVHHYKLMMATNTAGRCRLNHVFAST